MSIAQESAIEELKKQIADLLLRVKALENVRNTLSLPKKEPTESKHA